MKSLFVLIQATPVVPLPMQLSNTVSPEFVYVLISHSSSFTGFWVGCNPFSLGNFRIVVGFRLPSLQSVKMSSRNFPQFFGSLSPCPPPILIWLSVHILLVIGRLVLIEYLDAFMRF